MLQEYFESVRSKVHFCFTDFSPFFTVFTEYDTTVTFFFLKFVCVFMCRYRIRFRLNDRSQNLQENGFSSCAFSMVDLLSCDGVDVLEWTSMWRYKFRLNLNPFWHTLQVWLSLELTSGFLLFCSSFALNFQKLQVCYVVFEICIGNCTIHIYITNKLTHIFITQFVFSESFL